MALGEEALVSLDDLETTEPALAVVNQIQSEGDAILPEQTNDKTQTEPVAGTEIASGGNSVPRADELEDIEKNQEPDPYLVESAHILLDLISLKERSALEGFRAQGT